MDSDQGKLFIGGISWDTTEEKLNEYFGNYGQVLQSVIMRDKLTGRPRGFGFVAFADPSVLDRVLQDTHTIDGRTVEAKRALSREEQQSRPGNPNASRNFGSGGNQKTKKIFVGGLPPNLTEEEFRQYFETYGNVTDVVVMYDQATQRPRGFGFISFDTEEAVDRVLHKSFHELSGKNVEVKRALPKDANPGSGGHTGGGGGYQGYGASNANAGYDGRQASGGFQGYGSGYGAQGYGNTGGYSAGGYGSAAAGYNAGYGNQSAPNVGYGGGQPGASRGQWNSQDPSGYGSAPYTTNMGYRTDTYSAPVAGGNTASGGTTAPSGQYNNEYGYGGGNGYYGNQSGYGAVRGQAGGNQGTNAFGGSGGEQQSAGGGYMGGGYGDANGSYPAQAGYGASQANGPPGGQVGYGGGYGAAQTRQTQQ